MNRDYKQQQGQPPAVIPKQTEPNFFVKVGMQDGVPVLARKHGARGIGIICGGAGYYAPESRINKEGKVVDE